mmetsp:Transcript_30382/g.69937  ORF Transcript_30382/g.69937 Transcript_30382/m.69937 type:complete len:242 (-) Transcript_30382:138-863(-)
MGTGCSCEDATHEKDSIKNLTNQAQADMLGAEDVPHISLKTPPDAHPSRNYQPVKEEGGGHVEQPWACKDPRVSQTSQQARNVAFDANGGGKDASMNQDVKAAERNKDGVDSREVPQVSKHQSEQSETVPVPVESGKDREESDEKPGTFILEAVGNGAKLGCFLGHKHQSSTIEVLQVLDKGIVPAWNQLHPDKQIEVGCLILSVNDSTIIPRGREEMLQEISAALRKPHLKLVVQRNPGS